MSENRISTPHRWKIDAFIADLYRASTTRNDEQSVVDLEEGTEQADYHEDLIRTLGRLAAAYNELDTTHIRPLQDIDPSAASRLKNLIGCLVRAAVQIGIRTMVDAPAGEAAKASFSSLQAQRARSARQLKLTKFDCLRRRVILEAAGGVERLRAGPKFASSIRCELISNPKFAAVTNGARGFSTPSIKRAIDAILEEDSRSHS
jgi:hypothetical protein